MKSLRTLAAGLVISLAAPLASAALVVLDFDDLPTPGGVGGTFGVEASFDYKGFYFGPDADGYDTGSANWFWAPSEPNYPTATGTGNNITPAGDVSAYHATVISSTVPFQFKSAFFSGPANSVIGIELVEVASFTSHFLGSFLYDPVTNTTTLGTGDASTFFGGTFSFPEVGTIVGTNTGYSYTFTNTEEPDLWLQKVVIWGQGYGYAVDDINVNVVPEPSAYAMALVGLAGLALLARRRRQ